MIERIIEAKPVQKSVIDQINLLLSHRHGYTELVQRQDRFNKIFHAELNEPIDLLALIAESAADLLCHNDFSRIKGCENSGCILYFYDTSKNHTRRWCSMEVCGNRMKAAAHYRRHQHKKRRVHNQSK
jgi:predicted RNA-binding Zn ribbon-like protein